MRRWPEYPSLYFNQAGAGPTSPAVLEQVRAVDEQLAAIGGHSPAGLDLVEATLAGTRAAMAARLGVPRDWSVSFCGSATDALNLVASAVVARRCRLLASDQEHPSGFLSLAVQRGRGFELAVLAAAPLDSFADRVARARREADLVLASYVSYQTGWRLPVERIPPPAADDGLLLIDVSQALGQVRLSQVWPVADVAVGLGHKWLHGPLPTGFVLTSPRAHERLAIARGGWHARLSSERFDVAWRSDAARFEPGSMDAARVAGLNVALSQLDVLLEPAARQRVATFRAQVVEALRRAGCEPLADSVEGMVIFRVDRSARDVAAAIAQRSGAIVKDLNAPEVTDRVRISLCPLHTPDEIDRLCWSLGSV
jgi:selenocysteine lyase/cysteine desulfurase